MKKSGICFVLLNISLLFHQSFASGVHFISQPKDSLIQQTYCWQPGNLYRPIISLEGEWEYRITEKNSFKKVRLPASCDHWGEITFRKEFIPDSSLTNHFFRLVCYGINYYCTIFINDKFIGSHSGGYSSFAIDIADGVILINQKNVIEIKVDTRLDSKNTIPQQYQPEGLKNVFGIFRSIYLLALPELSIEDVLIDYQLTKDFSECELEVNFNLKDRIDNFSDEVTYKGSSQALYYYIELNIKTRNKPILSEWQELNVESYKLIRVVSTKIKFKQPQLWNPEAPTLYSLRIQLFQDKEVIDQFDQLLGIKQINFQNGNIYLNGQRFVLKGVNWAEDYLVVGALFDRNQLLKDLELVKQLNANAIRALNHQAHPMLANLCDSLGIFLLQEIPLNWVPTSRFNSDIFLSHCSDYLYETVLRDYAHVCIFAWGIGGQFVLSESSYQNFMNKLTNNLSTINHQPFYFWNSPPFLSTPSNSNIIAGVAIYNFEKNEIQDVLAKWIKRNNGRINLVLSYGAPQLGVLSSNGNSALYEEYRVLQIVEAWRTITSFPDIDGYFFTALSDYQGNYPSTIFRNCIDGSLRPVGLTNYNRKKRVAFETIRSLYKVGKYHYNPRVDLKNEMPATYPLVGLASILVFLLIVNSRRYFRENLKRIFIHPHGFYVDIRDGRKIPLSHTIFMALFISVGCGLLLASFLSFFKNHPHFDHLMTILLRTTELKTKICRLSWQPNWSILFFSILTLVMFFLLTIYFKLIALITRKRCSFIQCLTVPFWLAGNLLTFIPIGTVVFRIFQFERFIMPIVLLIFLLGLWFFFRVVNGMRVLFIWTIRKTFIIVTITIFVCIAGIFYYYQSQYALLDYLKFYYQIYGNQIFTTHLY